jgi:hypothetical protein
MMSLGPGVGSGALFVLKYKLVSDTNTVRGIHHARFKFGRMIIVIDLECLHVSCRCQSYSSRVKYIVRQRVYRHPALDFSVLAVEKQWQAMAV